MSDTADLLTTPEAAIRLGVSVRRVQALIGAGRLPATKHGRDRLFRPEDVAVLRTRHTTPGPRPKRAEGQ